MIVEGSARETYARARTLEVIQLHDDLALVQGALNRGDQVIVNGLNRIVPGQKILATLVENSMAIPSPEGVSTPPDEFSGSFAPSGTLP